MAKYISNEEAKESGTAIFLVVSVLTLVAVNLLETL